MLNALGPPCLSTNVREYNMRSILTSLFLLATVLGCHSPQNASEKDLAIWRSSDAALDKRMDAASRLVPAGTKQAEAERLLGEPTRRERWHGPSVLVEWGKPGKPSIPSGYHNSWHDIYDFKNGDYIDASFDIEASPSKWEDRPLRCISNGNTNRETK